MDCDSRFYSRPAIENSWIAEILVRKRALSQLRPSMKIFAKRLNQYCIIICIQVILQYKNAIIIDENLEGSETVKR